MRELFIILILSVLIGSLSGGCSVNGKSLPIIDDGGEDRVISPSVSEGCGGENSKETNAEREEEQTGHILSGQSN